jgi:D-3-phosphoglycerate dehydrogenase
MSKKTVLLDTPIHDTALQKLAKGAHVLTAHDAPTDQVLALLRQAHGLILGSKLAVGAAEMDLGQNLEVIGRHGVGTDNVDQAAATERGIPFVYTPYGPTESTAEHALLLMLATARRLSQMDRAVRTGSFDIRHQAQAMGHELHGKTLGVVGFGRIGQRLAEMCRDALHMPVHVFDPYLDRETVAAWGAVYEEGLSQLARNVDILSIHTPLTPQTYHLINRDAIQAMRPGSILINASRGPVVDQAALVEALQEGHLGGAGLDVFDPQPPTMDDPLLQFEQVVLTPHIASFTHEGRERMGLTVVEDVLCVLQGERPRYLANPDVWAHRRFPQTGT